MTVLTFITNNRLASVDVDINRQAIIMTTKGGDAFVCHMANWHKFSAAIMDRKPMFKHIIGIDFIGDEYIRLTGVHTNRVMSMSVKEWLDVDQAVQERLAALADKQERDQWNGEQD